MVKNSFVKKDICCRYTLELHLWGNSNVNLQHYVTENKENYLEIYTNQVSCPLSLPKLLISAKITCRSIANCLYLHDSYISKFELMNY